MPSVNQEAVKNIVKAKLKYPSVVEISEMKLRKWFKFCIVVLCKNDRLMLLALFNIFPIYMLYF